MTPSPVASRAPRANAGAVRLPAVRPASRRGERGAVLVHVAVAMMGLLAFSALTIDLGTLWVSRAQAQNAADAAALSAGVSLAYIDETDEPGARAAAEAVAGTHSVWGEPVLGPALSTTVGACPTGSPAIAGVCANVTVSRRTTTGTALPVFFSRLFGATSGEMWASASAKVLLGNAATCPRPLAIPDRWLDNHDDTLPVDTIWREDDAFDGYTVTGAPIPGFSNPDGYAPASASSVGQGWALTHVRPSPRRTFVLSTEAPNDPVNARLRGDQLLALDFTGFGVGGTPAIRYGENLQSCSGASLAIGRTLPTVYVHRTFYTHEPLTALIASDGSAYWDEAAQAVRGSNPDFVVSPRIITIAVIDPQHYTQQDRSSLSGDSNEIGADVVVRNLVGFFVEEVRSTSEAVFVSGRLVRTSGTFNSSAPLLTDQATFLRTVALVR